MRVADGSDDARVLAGTQPLSFPAQQSWANKASTQGLTETSSFKKFLESRPAPDALLRNSCDARPRPVPACCGPAADLREPFDADRVGGSLQLCTGQGYTIFLRRFAATVLLHPSISHPHPHTSAFAQLRAVRFYDSTRQVGSPHPIPVLPLLTGLRRYYVQGAGRVAPRLRRSSVANGGAANGEGGREGGGSEASMVVYDMFPRHIAEALMAGRKVRRAIPSHAARDCGLNGLAWF
jgi:hypothetical protein